MELKHSKPSSFYLGRGRSRKLIQLTEQELQKAIMEEMKPMMSEVVSNTEGHVSWSVSPSFTKDGEGLTATWPYKVT